MQRRRRAATTLVAAVLAATACAMPGQLAAAAPKAASPGRGTFQVAGFSWGTTFSNNPYSASFPSPAWGLVDLPLAFQLPPTAAHPQPSYLPQVATSWSINGDRLIVHLRAGMRWQNGKPVTSKDVYGTTVASGTGGGLWSYIDNITTPSPTEVVFTIQPGTPPKLAEVAILTGFVYPSSVYSVAATASLEHAEAQSAQLALENKRLAKAKVGATKAAQDLANGQSFLPAAQAAKYKAIQTQLQAAYKKLADVNPKTMIGDGPFKLGHINSFEGTFTKSQSFYNASKEHLAGIDVTNISSNQQGYGLFFGGRSDLTFAFAASNIVHRVLTTPNAHIFSTPNYYGIAYVYNCRRYPLSLTSVRQAMTYLIPRKAMADAAYGGIDPGGVYQSEVDGLIPEVANGYLTAGQIRSLNSYPNNPKKAAQLLRSAGLKKQDGTWRLPDGKPFTINLLTVSGYSDVITAFELAEKTLTNFGIKTTVSAAPDGADLNADVQKGNFDVVELSANSLDPLDTFQGLLGTTWNFINSTEPGIGFGPKATLPGVGRVNVPLAINTESAEVAGGSRMRQLVWDWARLVNKQVPYVIYDDSREQHYYSTARLKDWPPHSSSIWDFIAYNTWGGIDQMIEHGYLRPA